VGEGARRPAFLIHCGGPGAAQRLGGAGVRAWQAACPYFDNPSGSCGRLCADMTSGLFTRVTFKVCVDQTQFGDSVFVTGNAPILGNRPCPGGPACAPPKLHLDIVRLAQTPRHVGMWDVRAACCCCGAPAYLAEL
jgi:hypothetical protein